MSYSIEDYAKLGFVFFFVLFLAHNFGIFNNQQEGTERPIDVVNSVEQLVIDNKQLQSHNEILKKNLENTENYDYIRRLENRPAWIGVILITMSILLSSVLITYLIVTNKRIVEGREYRERIEGLTTKIEELPVKYQKLFKEKENDK